MERRHRCRPLSPLMARLFTITLLCAGNAVAEDRGFAALNAPIAEPQVLRLDTTEPRVRVDDNEIGGFIGQLATEDFGTNWIYGVSLQHHASEDVFYALTLAQSDTQRTSAERLRTDVFLELDDDRTLRSLQASVGWNLVHGQLFREGRAYPTTGYLVAGGGMLSVFGDDEFCFNAGAGLRVMLDDTMALNADVREYIYDSDVLVTDRTYNDLELRIGLSRIF